MLQNKYKPQQNPNPRRRKTNYSYFKYAVIFVFMAAIVVAGFVVKNKNSKLSNAVNTHTAFASEIPGWWNQQYFGASLCDSKNCKSESDPDGDGLTNSQEYFYHSDPNNAHTVGDSMNDGELVAHNFDPSKPGRVTFEQATSDDEILGESLLFEEDIQRMINESVDPNKIQLPTIADRDLKISNENTKENFLAYVKSTEEISKKYFPSDTAVFVAEAMRSNDPTRIADVSSRINKSVDDLKNTLVPSELLTLHKYMILFLQVLPDVMNPPANTSNINDPAVNAWYDKTQQAMVLYQKITLETNRLKAIK